MSDDLDLDSILRPQIEAEQLITDILCNAGIGDTPAKQLAWKIIARMALHDPPILLCFPDQIKD